MVDCISLKHRGERNGTLIYVSATLCQRNSLEFGIHAKAASFMSWSLFTVQLATDLRTFTTGCLVSSQMTADGYHDCISASALHLFLLPTWTVATKAPSLSYPISPI